MNPQAKFACAGRMITAYPARAKPTLNHTD